MTANHHAKTMRKVLHVGPCNAPGGMATVMHTLAEHPPEGWEAELLPTYSSGHAWSKWIAYRTARRALRDRLSGASKVDIVHVHVASDWSWYRKARLIRLAQRRNAGVVVHLHSGAFERWMSFRARVQRQFRTLTTQPQTTLVALNEHWKETFSAYSDEVEMVPNPVPPQIQPTTVNRDSNHLLLLGRADPVKGHDFAEQLVTALREQRPTLTLTVTGREHSSVEGVNALGWVSASTKRSLLNEATLLVVPSGYEGQPLVMLEALASGCPVIVSSNVSSPPSEAVVAKHGQLQEWVAKVTQQLDDPTDEQRLCQSVEAHAVHRVATQWSRVYALTVDSSNNAE